MFNTIIEVFKWNYKGANPKNNFYHLQQRFKKNTGGGYPPPARTQGWGGRGITPLPLHCDFPGRVAGGDVHWHSCGYSHNADISREETKPVSMERKEKSVLAAKVIFLVGGIVFVSGVVLSIPGSSVGLPLCGVGVILMAAGLVLMKRPEYLVLLAWQ